MNDTDTSPVAELRAAATKLRDQAATAHRASPAPWRITDEHVVRCADGMIVADRSGTDHPAERADLPYIETVHPGVGTALADWLDAEAVIWDAVETLKAEFGPKGLKVTTPMSTHDQALAVARQILGSAQ